MQEVRLERKSIYWCAFWLLNGLLRHLFLLSTNMIASSACQLSPHPLCAWLLYYLFFHHCEYNSKKCCFLWSRDQVLHTNIFYGVTWFSLLFGTSHSILMSVFNGILMKIDTMENKYNMLLLLKSQMYCEESCFMSSVMPWPKPWMFVQWKNVLVDEQCMCWNCTKHVFRIQ